MEQEEINKVMAGMDQVYREEEEEDRLNKVAPKCHFRPMMRQIDSFHGSGDEWWECSVCSHVKDL